MAEDADALRARLPYRDCAGVALFNSRGQVFIGRRKRGEDPRPAPCSLFEAADVVFLVRGMDAIVVEPETDQQAVHAEGVAERRHDRDRCPATHKDGGLSPFLFKCFGGGLHRRIGGVEADGPGAMMAKPCRLAIGRQDLIDVIVKGLHHLVRVLAGHEAAGNLS